MDVTVVVADLKLAFKNFPSETKKKTTGNLNNNNGWQAHNVLISQFI
jgi:hypothetical protein